ncbi:MAG TPA: aminotransferase class V-fold PLP-dependent enzyme, partial [Usitatibacteraceae bacterium]|nr:aminotransferase class V-fold PLP-dependent enzyme [Usitatibacteraceae bacterium]
MDIDRNPADGIADGLLPRSGEPFGHALRRYWTLDPAVHFLNHGSYGACPRHVLNRQAQWRALMEREPVRFMNDILPQALREARDALAEFVGATPQNLVFVENATAGVNAVLRSQDWRTGEAIVLANHAYPAVKNTARFLAQLHGLRVVEADIPWPLTDAGAIVDAYVRAISAGARVAVVDHIFSPLAVETPLDQIARACRSQGVMLVVDGAHAPALLPLELDALAALGVDCYTGNAHKWLCAP